MVWATQKINQKQGIIDLTVRLHCVGEPELIKRCLDGIGRYWSRDVRLKNQIWTVNTKVVNDPTGVKFKLYGHAGQNKRCWSYYPFGSTIVHERISGLQNLFEVDCAHEFGHVVLCKTFRWIDSITHKGTSTPWSSHWRWTKSLPLDGEIDLMKYHTNTYLDPVDYLNRVVASETDVISLVSLAKKG